MSKTNFQTHLNEAAAWINLKEPCLKDGLVVKLRRKFKAFFETNEDVIGKIKTLGFNLRTLYCLAFIVKDAYDDHVYSVYWNTGIAPYFLASFLLGLPDQKNSLDSEIVSFCKNLQQANRSSGFYSFLIVLFDKWRTKKQGSFNDFLSSKVNNKFFKIFLDIFFKENEGNDWKTFFYLAHDLLDFNFTLQSICNIFKTQRENLKNRLHSYKNDGAFKQKLKKRLQEGSIKKSKTKEYRLLKYYDEIFSKMKNRDETSTRTFCHFIDLCTNENFEINVNFCGIYPFILFSYLFAWTNDLKEFPQNYKQFNSEDLTYEQFNDAIEFFFRMHIGIYKEGLKSLIRLAVHQEKSISFKKYEHLLSPDAEKDTKGDYLQTYKNFQSLYEGLIGETSEFSENLLKPLFSDFDHRDFLFRFARFLVDKNKCLPTPSVFKLNFNVWKKIKDSLLAGRQLESFSKEFFLEFKSNSKIEKQLCDNVAKIISAELKKEKYKNLVKDQSKAVVKFLGSCKIENNEFHTDMSMFKKFISENYCLDIGDNNTKKNLMQKINEDIKQRHITTNKITLQEFIEILYDVLIKLQIVKDLKKCVTELNKKEKIYDDNRLKLIQDIFSTIFKDISPIPKYDVTFVFDVLRLDPFACFSKSYTSLENVVLAKKFFDVAGKFKSIGGADAVKLLDGHYQKNTQFELFVNPLKAIEINDFLLYKSYAEAISKEWDIFQIKFYFKAKKNALYINDGQVDEDCIIDVMIALQMEAPLMKASQVASQMYKKWLENFKKQHPNFLETLIQQKFISAQSIISSMENLELDVITFQK